MGAFVLKNPSVRINLIDLSDHVKEVTVNLSADDVDVTASGALGKQHLAGLRDDKFELTMFSDFATGKVDATLWPLFNGSSLFLVEVWAAGTVTAATNPSYSGTGILTDYDPIAGAIGDAAMTPLTIPVNGFISRATS